MKADNIQAADHSAAERMESPDKRDRKRAKILILFFSGTGNTQFIAEYIRDHLLSTCPDIEYTITLAALEWASPEIVADYDLVCLGFPVYEGRAPANVRDFLESLPVVHDKGAFVFNTKGLAQGRANRSVMTRFSRQGFRPLGSASIIMPASDGISMMLKKDSKKLKEFSTRDFSQVSGADRLVEKIGAAVRMLRQNRNLEGMPRDAAVTVLGFLMTGIFRLMYVAFGDPMKKKLRVTEACNLCGICVEQCPTGNITEEAGRIVFGNKCVLCLRCVNNCPREALQLGKMSVGKGRWHGPGGGYKPLRYKSPRTVASRNGE